MLQILKSGNQKIKHIQTKSLVICICCRKENQPMTIKLKNCEHMMCKECFISEAFKNSPFFIKSDLQHTKCMCGAEISEEVVNRLLSSEEIEKNHQKALEPFKEKVTFQKARLECPICQQEITAEEAITLSCEHKFCSECLYYTMKLKIEAKQVRDEDLCCVQCKRPLIVPELIFLLNQFEAGLWDKCENFKTQLYFEDEKNLGKDAKIDCPKCVKTIKFVEKSIFKTLYDWKCEICGQEFCPQYGCARNHKGMSCQEYADKL